MPFLEINNFSGGQSDSEKIGVKGSFAEGVGLDIHSEPHILKANQRLRIESGAIVDQLCKFALLSSDGNSYWFGNAGKIFRRTSAGVWSLVRTNTQGGNRGAREFNDFIYYASATALGRYGPLSGTPTWTDNWQVLDNAEYHQMTVQGLHLLIANARKIATVEDTGIFTAQGIPGVTLASLPRNFEIRTVANFGIDVLAGTRTIDSHTSARMFRWDVASPAYISDDEIPEYWINAFIPTDNAVYVQAGRAGNIYLYDGERLLPRKKIRGDYASKTMVMHPQSYTSFRGLPLFGISNDAGNACLQGVYSLGRYDGNYPLAINLEYLISRNTTVGVEIGAMLVIGNNLLVAWREGVNFGVDVIDWENKYSAYIKTLILTGSRFRNKDFKNYVLSYKSRPVGTNLTLEYALNNGALTPITLIDDTADAKLKKQETIAGGFIQFKIGLAASGNNTPELSSFYVDWDERRTL